MFQQILPFLSILIFRFFGLFIVLPVISLLIADMSNAHAWNIGMTIGAPYLFQVICQPLLGRWSDKYGRKRILIVGLIIFLIGSVICMLEDSIYYLMIGRCVQGMGAIGGILTALVADCVREEKRTGAMALMGVGIFISFVIAMFLGPILGATYGLNSLFGLTVAVSIVSLLIAIFFVKPSPKILYSYSQDSKNIKTESNIKRSIFIVSASNFIEKLLMIFTFAIAPIILEQYLEKTHFWTVYVPAIIFGVIVLGPASVLSEKRGKSLDILFISIVFFLVSYMCMSYYLNNFIAFGISLALFFAGFCVQEALLQSLVSKYAKAHVRGAVIGDFSAAGFAGSFLGAMIGGFFHSYETIVEYHIILFSVLVICIMIWGIVVRLYLVNPHNTETLYVHKADIGIGKDNIESLLNRDNIIEWYENTNEGVLVIKYVKGTMDSEEMRSLLNVR